MFLKSIKGFTLIEMMVALVLLSIGMLGFSAMSILMVKATRTASTADEAATISQSTIETLTAITWANLGTDTAMPAPNGLNNAQVRTEGPLNRNGEAEGTGTGPYLFYRHVVVCSNTTSTVAPGASPDLCATSITASNRPATLSCSTITPALTAREKMIRVLVSWLDRNGQCRYKNNDSLSFQ